MSSLGRKQYIITSINKIVIYLLDCVHMHAGMCCGFLLIWLNFIDQKMGIELSNLKSALKDEVSKLKSHVTLDINLERGRSLEAVSV